MSVYTELLPVRNNGHGGRMQSRMIHMIMITTIVLTQNTGRHPWSTLRGYLYMEAVNIDLSEGVQRLSLSYAASLSRANTKHNSTKAIARNDRRKSHLSPWNWHTLQ